MWVDDVRQRIQYVISNLLLVLSDMYLLLTLKSNLVLLTEYRFYISVTNMTNIFCFLQIVIIFPLQTIEA